MEGGGEGQLQAFSRHHPLSRASHTRGLWPARGVGGGRGVSLKLGEGHRVKPQGERGMPCWSSFRMLSQGSNITFYIKADIAINIECKLGRTFF